MRLQTGTETCMIFEPSHALSALAFSNQPYRIVIWWEAVIFGPLPLHPCHHPIVIRATPHSIFRPHPLISTCQHLSLVNILQSIIVIMIINHYLMRHRRTWPIRILKCSPITILSIHTPRQHRRTMPQRSIILRLTICRIRIPIHIFSRCIRRATSRFHLPVAISRRHRWTCQLNINTRYHSGTRRWSKCAVTTVRRRTRVGVLHHPGMDANLSFSLLCLYKKEIRIERKEMSVF